MIQIAMPYSWLLLMTQKICLILQYTGKSFTAIKTTYETKDLYDLQYKSFTAIKTTLWTFDRV